MGVMLDFYPIYMKFSMEVEIDVLNDYPKFGCDQLISCLVEGHTKKIQQILFPCPINNG